MAVIQTKPVQDLLKEWKEKQVNNEFFWYLGFLGRIPEEIKEIVYRPEDKAAYVTFHDMATATIYTELTDWK